VPITEPYRVLVVVDRDYGQRLAELAQSGPVWIVDTPANRTAAQQIWAADPNRSHLKGVTTFKFREESSSEDILINELDTIDLHHGTHSASPPYTVLDVIGTAITARLRDLGRTTSRMILGRPQLKRSAMPAPLAAVLPQDVMTHTTLVATMVFAGAEDDRAAS
jgi:hypothetical protein